MRHATTPCRAPDAGVAGFSLAELVYVLLIMGVLASIALPRIDMGRSRVDGGAMEIASHLMLAQRVAVLRQHDVRVLADTAAAALRMHEDRDNDGTQDVGEPVVMKALGDGVALALAGSQGLHAGSGAVTFAEGPEKMPVLVFHRNGSASEEGVLHVTSAGAGRSDHDRAVHVERATGLSTCWSRRTGAWQEGC